MSSARIASLASLIALTCLASAASLRAAEPSDPLKASPETIAKWRQMRFGMFIHWGPVSLKGTEIGWSRGAEVPVEEYDNLYKQFSAPKFDADEWVKVAKEAGVKYIVLTTKHHDGFCLWNTKQTDHNVMNSPLKRDVVKELAAACKKQGIAFGTYYSTCDWHHPDFPLGSPGGQTKKPNPNLDRYEQYLTKQVGELLHNYGPLCTLWFDVPQEFSVERGQRVVKAVRAIQPDIMINNRTGYEGDYDTPEQTVGNMQTGRPWETCMTICQQWAWKPNDEMKSLKECLHVLVNTVGGDGNLLFNVGPMPDGRIEPRQVARLKEMGQWLEKYGESIYGTRGGPFPRAAWGAATHKDDTIYLHILDPKLDTLKLPALKQKIVSSSVMTGGTATVKQSDDGIEVSVPKSDRQDIDTIVVLKLDAPAAK